MAGTLPFEIIVIAMRREVERRELAEAAFRQLGVMRYRFVDGADGKDAASLDAITGYDSAKAEDIAGRELTPSEIACFDSHRRAWAYVASCEHPVLVLESDAAINQETLEVCRALCSLDMPAENFVMLNYHECLPSFWGRKRLVSGYKLVRFANKRVFTTSSYFLQPQAAKQLLLYGQEIFLPVDNFMTGGQVNKGMEAYAVYPRAAGFSALAAASNIQDEREGLRNTKKASWLSQKTLFLRNFHRKLRKPQGWL